MPKQPHIPPRSAASGAPAASGGEGWRPATLASAALLVLGAAVIHLAVVPEHLEEYPPFGLFFIVAGAAQVALAAGLLIAPSRRLFAAGLMGTLGLLALWAVDRTVGLPIGPEPGQPEPIEFADATCVLMELGAAALLLRLALSRPRLRARGAVGTALRTGPTFAAAAVLTALGVASAANGMPVASDAAPAPPGQATTPVSALTEAPGPQPVDRFTLTAEPRTLDGRQAWTFDGTVPGPELRVREGDRVVVTLRNHLPVSTTIHWHGVRVPNAEDGVAGVTQNAVPPGGSFTYDFLARDVGTYWYHSHQDTGEQIPRGLFGALVVEPPGGRVAGTRDYTVVLHSPVSGGGVAANGVTGDLRLAARPGETVRLRVVNAVAPGMDGGPEAPVLLGAPYRVVALDGHDLDGPQLLGPQRLPLGMGQRADLVFTMPATGVVRLLDTVIQGRTSAGQQAIQAVAGSAAQRATVTLGAGAPPPVPDLAPLPVFDLTRYGTPAADPVADRRPDATFPVVLDEHPGFHDGELALVHTINGAASPSVPPITVRQGQTVRLHIVNQTDEYHPMHLHGHVLSIVARDGAALQGSPVHTDTVLVGPHQTWDVAFQADNPGVWMLHCHVLLHASMGMSTTVDYAGVSTPFRMGSASGNVPE